MPTPRSPLDEQKTRVRGEARAVVAGVNPASLVEQSRRICGHLLASDAYTRARTLLVYAPMPGEADVGPVIAAALAAGKRVALPRVDWATDAMVPALIRNWPGDAPVGSRRMPEPDPNCPTHPVGELDLVLVPGVAFDRAGNRLGRGKGHFDRFLAALPNPAMTIGVALREQVVPAVPVGPLDRRVGWLLTPDGLSRAVG